MTNQLRTDLLPERHRGGHDFLIPCGRYTSLALIAAAVALSFYGVLWSYSTSRYLKGFSDAIVPLEGSQEQKTMALLSWLRNEPDRKDKSTDQFYTRDPVGIVQDGHLLQVCGSASNAFMNLAESAGLRTRRLLLLNPSGSVKHVVVEVRWDDRWVVVDPSFRSVFQDHAGRALSKEDLSHPGVFQDAIRGIPNYNPEYSFEHTAHIHLTRIPELGVFLRRTLNFLFPRWEETVNWGYLPEHPSLWPTVFSLPLFLLGIAIRMIVYSRQQFYAKNVGFRKRLIETSRIFLQRSA